MPSQICELLILMTESVSTLEKACADNGTEIPDLNEPFSPPSEAFRISPVAAEAAAIISAAALQLAAILSPPQVSLHHLVGGGMHAEEIAAKNWQDPEKLARFLRFLATNHVYREITPEVFANNRVSSMVDTLKPSKEIIADLEHKHNNTPGLAASHPITFKAAAYAWETLNGPMTRRSGDPRTSPFAQAFNTKETLWEFHERPDQSYRHRRFGIGMQRVHALRSVDAILSIVDVGSSVGTSIFPIAANFPKIQLIVQGLPGVVEDAKELWGKKMLDAVTSGQVKLEAHDFFQPQPQKNASVFLLKQITHDWSDEYCVKFLTRLWDAATPETVLLLVDSVMPFMVYNADIDMFLLFNFQERTIRHLDRLLRSAGWEITVVHRQDGDTTFLQSIEAAPIGK
ncbi:hypothetical protein HETIRDRAFT_105202 [Heterobasidion irregulare TC 32-1]|uniref:O-methyltransferase C-terminal domain-containing protein n=1 Tax=Heterobasidion irregulare (strain TC 32-1) TaxID=747525 RepID=W4K392_HETIT|nr:uncharacterized protein HETIRDRAFT_105202 [Heterobasidion irregulare TC 32-1]ETW80288.1 hypothetical protein HETIRDRAFT_105202 [Heterobasidion irregulare TC 32-1]